MSKIVKEKYSHQTRQTINERFRSEAFELRSINSWIKRRVINDYVRRESFVLDLGSGKGGDLNKFDMISGYIGVELSKDSISESRKVRTKFTRRYISGDFNNKEIAKDLERRADVFPITDAVMSFSAQYIQEMTDFIHMLDYMANSPTFGHLILFVPDPDVIREELKDRVSYSNDILKFEADPYDEKKVIVTLKDSLDAIPENFFLEKEFVELAEGRGLVLTKNENFATYFASSDWRLDRDFLFELSHMDALDSKTYEIVDTIWPVIDHNRRKDLVIISDPKDIPDYLIIEIICDALRLIYDFSFMDTFAAEGGVAMFASNFFTKVIACEPDSVLFEGLRHNMNVMMLDHAILLNAHFIHVAAEPDIIYMDKLPTSPGAKLHNQAQIIIYRFKRQTNTSSLIWYHCHRHLLEILYKGDKFILVFSSESTRDDTAMNIKIKNQAVVRMKSGSSLLSVDFDLQTYTFKPSSLDSLRFYRMLVFEKL